MNDRPLLTPAEVAVRLKVGRDTVYRLIRRYELPAVKIGRSYRITEEAYEAFITPEPARAPRTRPEATAQRERIKELLRGYV